MSRNSTKSNIQCCGVTQVVPFSKAASEILSYPEHKKIVESQGVSRSALGFNLDPRFVYPVDPGNYWLKVVIIRGNNEDDNWTSHEKGLYGNSESTDTSDPPYMPRINVNSSRLIRSYLDLSSVRGFGLRSIVTAAIPSQEQQGKLAVQDTKY
ncbi:hypothetical protein KQX54_020142 [Cotesia glomerata]|uniref:Uncharacterized protein n=1 Tax=Cotesia glomerata TaxID=32391 RepID=A0AAV7IFT1_COTGL|nr:hypothetical protein KQX54_020142 [Cotesia glomerata]